MPSFYVQNYGDTYINIAVQPSAPYTSYRVYVRTESGTKVYDQWYNNVSTAASFSAYVSGLQPNTTYVINVAYATQQAGSDTTWIGAQTQTTRPQQITYRATLSYSANGGTGSVPSAQTMTGETQSIGFPIPTSPVPSQTGYTFGGWSINGVTYQPGTTAWLSGSASGTNYTAYAVWVSNTGGGVYIGGQVYDAYIYQNGWYALDPYVYANGWKLSGS